MTKFAKISLVAAVAVAGLTTANAQPLEEAIKGVDVSGMMRYRYDDTKKDNTASTQTHEYTLKVATKAKVNDIVAANVQVEASGVNITDTGSTASNTYNSTHATTDATGDRDVNLVVSKANFAANLGVATVIAGKQSVPSPFVDNTVDDNTRGTGAVALIPAGPVTIAAGHFTNFQNISDAGAATYFGQNIDTVGLLGAVGGVSFDAWYVDVDTVAKAQSIGAKTSVAGINLDARYSEVDPEGAAAKGSLGKIVASTKIGSVNLVAGYAQTNKANTGVTLDDDKDAASGFVLWQARADKLSDAKAYLIGAGAEVLPGLTLDVKYVDVNFGVNSDASETLLSATYAMSKNLSLHTRYSMYEQDNVDTTKGRLEVKYTF